MTPKTKLFEQIEEYCMNRLSKAEKKELEFEINQNPDLKEEFELECEVHAALSENDVIELRDKLKAIGKQAETKSFHFDLLDGFEHIQPLTKILPPEELLKFYDSLPKAHIYHHELISNENIHEFFREQNRSGLIEDFLDEEPEEDQEPDVYLEGLEEAVLEKDILKLRDNLSIVSEDFREFYSTGAIDDYLNGRLHGRELEEFNRELAVNPVLQREVNLHRDVETALQEIDIMNLRAEIIHCVNTETSLNVTEKQIEDYIDGTLAGEGLQTFHDELADNHDLKAELALRKKVGQAVSEKNVIALRDKLHHIRQEVEVSQTKSIVPDKKISHIQWWRAGVAVVLILFAFAGLLRNTFYSPDHYFQSPQWSPSRSVETGTDILQQANNCIITGMYEEALSLYDKAIAEANGEKYVYQFYKAACLQNMGKYEDAIFEYSQVTDHGNNMFVEEAEWYKAMINLKLGKKELAKNQLLSIVEKNGFYAQDARAIIRKTRLSFR